MKGFAPMRTLDVWYSRLDVDALRSQWAAAVSKAQLKQFERNVARARARDSLTAFGKLTHLVDGQPRMSIQVILMPHTQRQQVAQRVPVSDVIPARHHEVVHTKKVAVDYPVSLADAADEPPPSKPGPDRPIAVHVVCRLPRVIHCRVGSTGS